MYIETSSNIWHSAAYNICWNRSTQLIFISSWPYNTVYLEAIGEKRIRVNLISSPAPAFYAEKSHRKCGRIQSGRRNGNETITHCIELIRIIMIWRCDAVSHHRVDAVSPKWAARRNSGDDYRYTCVAPRNTWLPRTADTFVILFYTRPYELAIRHRNGSAVLDRQHFKAKVVFWSIRKKHFYLHRNSPNGITIGNYVVKMLINFYAEIYEITMAYFKLFDTFQIGSHTVHMIWRI